MNKKFGAGIYKFLSSLVGHKKPAMPTCEWIVGEDPVHGSKKVTCVGFDVWLVGNTMCPFCQKPISWRSK